MRSNAEVDFVISDEDMDTLINVEQIKDYGRATVMPVYRGRLNLRSAVSAAFRSRRNE
jgi:hypothetical protein